MTIHRHGYKTGSLKDSDGNMYKFMPITSSGEKKEGTPFRYGFPTASEAFVSYELHKQEYIQDALFVYWREAPDLFKNDDGQWVVYSRLLASDKELFECP